MASTTSSKGTTFTVTINGRVEKRTSKRAYTHACLGLRDGNKRLAHFQAPYTGNELKEKQREWADMQKYVGGEWAPHADPFWANSGWLQSVDRMERVNGTMRPVIIKPDLKATFEQEAKDGFDAWLAREHAKRLEVFHEQAARGQYQWHVVCWSHTEANAAKNPDRKYFDQLRVVPVGTVIDLAGDYRA